MVRILRHCQPKGAETDRPNLQRRALYTSSLNPKKFNPLLDKLLQAQHEGRREPIWPREGGGVAFAK